MDEGKQELCLSEIFLETLNGDFSLKAILRALKKCDEDMRQKLYDFWDVYREFDAMLTPEMKKEYLILQIL